MENSFLLGLLLTILPLSELRLGLPVALSSGLFSPFVFLSVLLLNVLMIFVIFFFLDFFHEKFLSFRWYQKIFSLLEKRVRKKVKKLERSYQSRGFLALVLFVAVPLPLTGVWSGCLVSWLLGLDHKKSILSIATGVLIAGTIIYAGFLGLSFFR